MKKALKIFFITLIMLLSIVAGLFLWFVWKVGSGFDCGYSNSYAVIDSIRAEGKEYHLVLSTSGFSDKVRILQLYQGGLNFDECHVPTNDPLYSEVIDEPERGPIINEWVHKVYLEGDKLEVLYSSEIKDVKKVSELALEIRSNR